MARLLASLPAGFPRWSPLAQDQYLEVRTLLSGYLLSSQGDRMLMAHSVEGRFPFLDPDVVALANSLPAVVQAARPRREARAEAGRRAGWSPTEILARTKQPYRAPDASRFVGPDAPAWVGELLGPAAVREAGVFRPEAVAGSVAKCQGEGGRCAVLERRQHGLVGVLSTQLLWDRFVRSRPDALEPPADALKTVIDLARPRP